jgi:hypothetical protein
MRQTINSLISEHIKDQFSADSFNIYAIEDCKCDICKAQDVFGGKDYVVVANPKSVPIMVSYAVRYQPTYDFKTFTIRETTYKGTKTEVKKRVAQSFLNTDYSTYTMQIYKTYCGIALSKELNQYLAKNEDTLETITNNDGSDFKVIRWSKYKTTGFYFKSYNTAKENLNNV